MCQLLTHTQGAQGQTSSQDVRNRGARCRHRGGRDRTTAGDGWAPTGRRKAASLCCSRDQCQGSANQLKRNNSAGETLTGNTTQNRRLGLLPVSVCTEKRPTPEACGAGRLGGCAQKASSVQPAPRPGSWHPRVPPQSPLPTAAPTAAHSPSSTPVLSWPEMGSYPLQSGLVLGTLFGTCTGGRPNSLIVLIDTYLIVSMHYRFLVHSTVGLLAVF